MAKPLFNFGSKFLDSLVRLPKEVHSKLIKCLILFSRDPQHPGPNVERLRGGAEGFCSARVDIQYRLVFAQPSQEDVRLLFVGTHDDAYEYAERAGSELFQEIRSANEPVEPANLETFLQLSSRSTKKYLPLSKYLMNHPTSLSRLEMTFAAVENIIGDSLPPAARRYRAWWANDHTRHVQSSAWLGVGWKTQDVVMGQGRFSLVRASKTVSAAHS